MGDSLKSDSVYFLLLLQDHVYERTGKQRGQQNYNEQGHYDHRHQHMKPE